MNKNKFTVKKLAIGVGAVATLMGANLYAAEQEKVVKKINTMEEVMVTARKREETLQEAPVAITVIGAEAIENAGVVNMQDIGARLPNVSTNDQPAGLNGNGFAPQIRGMRSGSRQIGEESGLGIFLDGAYAGSNAAGNKFLPPIERVEFLPGPQATLFGKNTTLGVINMVTKKPGEQFEGQTKVSYGNNGHKDVSATVMGPVSETLSMGLTLGTKRYTGFETNHNAVEIPNDAVAPMDQHIGVGDGVVGPNMDAWGGTFQLAYRGDNNKLDLMIDHGENERTNQMPSARIEGFGATPMDTYNTSTLGRQMVRETGANLTYAHDLDAGTLTSISAFREFDTTSYEDDDLYPFRLVDIDIWDTSQKQFSQELRWAQELGPISYLAGLYYQNQQLEMDRGAFFVEYYDFNLHGEMKNKTYAAFINGDMDLNDAWGLELGLRYGKEDKNMPSYSQDGIPFYWEGSISDSRSTDNFSYTAAVTFAATDSLNTHFRYSRGYKSGGFTMDFVTDGTEPPPFYEFDDEKADSFELGAKWQVSDAMWLNTVLFFTKYTDLQVNQLVGTSNGAPYFAMGNAGKAETKGIETTLIYTGENLTLNASVGYNDAYYSEWIRPAGRDADGNRVYEDMKGREMPSPRFTSNLLASYDIGALTLIAEYSFRKGSPASPGREAKFHSDDVDQFNLRGRYKITENLSATLWVKNLTDKRAITGRGTNVQAGFFGDDLDRGGYSGTFFPTSFVAIANGDQITGGRQAPRHYGLDVTYKF